MTGRCLACKRRMPLSEFWAHQQTHIISEWKVRRDGTRLLWKPVSRQQGDLHAVVYHPL